MNRTFLNSQRPVRTVSTITKNLAALMLVGILAGTSGGQDATDSSRREAETIKQIESAGGRVYRISAADSSREVSFYLSSKPIGDEQLQGIDAIGQVIWVNLAGTNVTDQGLKHLSGLPIKKLHLERTKIGDEGMKHLKSFKDMTYLNIYDTQVTDAGLEHLKELKALKKLFVWKTAVTEAGISRLKADLPDLEIVGELKLEPVVVEEPKKEETKPESKPKDDKAKADKDAGKDAAADQSANKSSPNEDGNKKEADKKEADKKEGDKKEGDKQEG